MSEHTPTSGNHDERTKHFLRLLSKHERRLQAYILTLVPNWTDADELIQETRIRLWEQFDEFDPSKDFGIWSRTIAYFQVLTYRKRIGRENARFSAAFMESVAEEVAMQSSELDRRHVTLKDCLEKLDQKQRWILMRYYEGTESMKQIAESLGRPFEAFRKAILRTRLAVTRCVNKSLEGD